MQLTVESNFKRVELPLRDCHLDSDFSFNAYSQKMNNASTSTALAVKELESGEFHWMLLEEKTSTLEEQLAYTPYRVSPPYPDASAAWVAGYLIIRAKCRDKKRVT